MSRCSTDWSAVTSSELSQVGGDCSPGIAMQRNVAGAIGAQLYDVQALSCNAGCDARSQRGRVMRELILRSVESRDGLEVEAMRSAKQPLEMFIVPGLWKERENSAAVVVDDDDGCVQIVKFRRKQTIHVVVERQVADHKNERTTLRL